MVLSDSKDAAAVPAARRFYAKALSRAEQKDLEDALAVDGLNEEIALLRLRLLKAIEEHPRDLELMFKGAALLARLVQTRYGLSKHETQDLTEALDRAVASLGELAREGGDD